MKGGLGREGVGWRRRLRRQFEWGRVLGFGRGGRGGLDRLGDGWVLCNVEGRKGLGEADLGRGEVGKAKEGNDGKEKVEVAVFLGCDGLDGCGGEIFGLRWRRRWWKFWGGGVLGLRRRRWWRQMVKVVVDVAMVVVYGGVGGRGNSETRWVERAIWLKL